MKTKSKFITTILFLLVLGLCGAIAGTLGVIDLNKDLTEKEQQYLNEVSTSKGKDTKGTEKALTIIKDHIDDSVREKKYKSFSYLNKQCMLTEENMAQCIDALNKINFINKTVIVKP